MTEVNNLSWSGATISGRVVHREGSNVLVEVTASSNPTVVKPGQRIVLSWAAVVANKDQQKVVKKVAG